MSPLYLYAILAEAPAGELSGLAGEPIQVRPCAGLLAAVGELSAAPELEADTLRAHDAAVRRLAAAAPAVLPARFGSVLPDEATLLDAMRPRAARLREALEAVRGCDQMTLRFSSPGDVPAPPAPIAAESAETSGPGTRYLRGRRAQLPDPRRLPGVARVLEALAPFVRAERAESHARPPLVATVYHLVPRASLEAYRAALATASAGADVRVMASGPWPAYAFAPDELG